MFKLLMTLLLTFSLLAEEDEPDAIFSDLKITNHKLNLKLNQDFSYTSVTGKCPIFNDENEKTAELFFIAYEKEEEENRPITFFFPGGPGGAGTMEAICSVGPRRLVTSKEGKTIFPPYKIIDNPETLLEYTDLVFVDPVNCGFSQSLDDDELPFFYNLEGDIQTLGQFVQSFIDVTERWNSPIYLAGGSYGTVRCSGLALNLLQYDLAVKGIILDGCALDYSNLVSQRDQPLADCFMIPTFAATAWYHGRFWPDRTIEEVVTYARKFAFEYYAPLMLQPFRLNPQEKAIFEQSFADLIGLPVQTVRHYNCRINESIYASEFFRGERKTLGRLDSRYIGDVAEIDPFSSGDPSYLDTIGLGSAFQSYLQKELDTRFPFKPYISFSHQAFHYWNLETYDTAGFPNLFQRVRRALTINPNMKVFIGSGYYDCRTPFASTEYSFNHLELPSSYWKNLQFEYYEAGHGFIFDHPSLQKFKRDLTKFYDTERE